MHRSVVLMHVCVCAFMNRREAESVFLWRCSKQKDVRASISLFICGQPCVL